MIPEHTAALKALIAAQVARVYVTRADVNATLPYVVLHPDQGAATQTAFVAASDRRSWRFQTTVVGAGYEQVQWEAEKVDIALLDVKPTISGRKASPIRKDVSLPIERDEDLPTPLYMARDVWSMSTIPG